jgi:Transposase DDE domain group 1
MTDAEALDRSDRVVLDMDSSESLVHGQQEGSAYNGHFESVFRANEVRLQLSVLAYNLGNLWRRLVLPTRIDTWSLTSLQQRLVKTGGRLVKHARYYWLLLAESHLTRRLFGSMLQRIWALPVPTG